MTAPLAPRPAPLGVDVTLRCRCRRTSLLVEGARPEAANRVICHCAGCRRFAARFDPDALDARGGTERVQVSPASVSLPDPRQLRCLQQSPRGALRWVSRCCETPFGLTLRSRAIPFVGLDVARIDPPVEVAPLFGPMRARLNGRFPRTERAALKADGRARRAMLTHLAPLTARWWWQGDHRRSPFFDAKTGRPIVPVERETQEAPRWSATGC